MSLPRYDQITALPVTSKHVVGPEHLDVNGHMNIGHYFSFASAAMWSRNGDLGMDGSYIPERGMTTFTAEQHLRYLGESVEGDRLSVYARVVDAGAKSLHLLAMLVNDTREQLSCLMETLTVHVDYESRRPVAFPDDVAERIATAVKNDVTPWPLPLSGSLGVRR